MEKVTMIKTLDGFNLMGNPVGPNKLPMRVNCIVCTQASEPGECFIPEGDETSPINLYHIQEYVCAAGHKSHLPYLPKKDNV